MLNFYAPEVQIVIAALIVLSFSALALTMLGIVCRSIIGASKGKALPGTTR